MRSTGQPVIAIQAESEIFPNDSAPAKKYLADIYQWIT
jgi:hypothetical protein